MSDAAEPHADLRPDARAPSRFGEHFTLIVLAAMTVVLVYVRVEVLPSQGSVGPVEFEFENPMLDAQPGERVILYPYDHPANQQCTVVRPEGVVLRSRKGPERIGAYTKLRQGLAYLACSIQKTQHTGDVCGGKKTDDVLYGLNNFGMPVDTKVRVDSIRPQWMKWGERELVVYMVVFQRYGQLGGRWTTFISSDAPVAGLVKYSAILPQKSEVHFREIVGGR